MYLLYPLFLQMSIPQNKKEKSLFHERHFSFFHFFFIVYFVFKLMTKRSIAFRAIHKAAGIPRTFPKVFQFILELTTAIFAFYAKKRFLVRKNLYIFSRCIGSCRRCFRFQPSAAIVTENIFLAHLLSTMHTKHIFSLQYQLYHI